MRKFARKSQKYTIIDVIGNTVNAKNMVEKRVLAQTIA